MPRGYGPETVGAQDVKLSLPSSFLGRFAELGGSVDLYGNWVPARTIGDNDDPYTAATRVMAVAGYLENTQVPLEKARQIAIQDTKEHFEKEESPGGNPWPELELGYLHYKESQGYASEILQMSGALMERATSQEAWIVIGEVLVFDPMVLPRVDVKGKAVNYGAIQQAGRSGTRVEPGEGFEGFTTGSMPQRQFIGLSRKAIELIAAEFESWFRGVEEVFYAPVEMGSNIRGIFPVIGYSKYGQPRLSTGQFGRK